NGPLPGSAFGYRTKDEEQAWRGRDPIDRAAAQMTARNLLNPSSVAQLRSTAQELMNEVAADFVEGHEGKKRIVPKWWPSADFRDFGVRGDLSEFATARFLEAEDFCGEQVETRFVDAVADVMLRRMTHDERIVVMGEDVHRLKGGTNGATRG